MNPQKIPGDSSQVPQPSGHKEKTTPKTKFPAPTEEKKSHEGGGAGSGQFLGMHVTEEQKKQIYSNMSKQVIQQIKDDQDRQQKALDNIKKVAEGEEPTAY